MYFLHQIRQIAGDVIDIGRIVGADLGPREPVRCDQVELRVDPQVDIGILQHPLKARQDVRMSSWPVWMSINRTALASLAQP